MVVDIVDGDGLHLAACARIIFIFPFFVRGRERPKKGGNGDLR